MTSNYKRQYGDDLLKDDHRLKLDWNWCRTASGISKAVKDTWTHFQCSEAEISDFVLEAIQWNGGYESRICWQSSTIISTFEAEYSKTRLKAQIKAEKMLFDWLEEQLAICKELSGTSKRKRHEKCHR